MFVLGLVSLNKFSQIRSLFCYTVTFKVTPARRGGIWIYVPFVLSPSLAAPVFVDLPQSIFKSRSGHTHSGLRIPIRSTTSQHAGFSSTRSVRPVKAAWTGRHACCSGTLALTYPVPGQVPCAPPSAWRSTGTWASGRAAGPTRTLVGAVPSPSQAGSGEPPSET